MEIVSTFIEGVSSLSPSMQGGLILLGVVVLLVLFLEPKPKQANQKILAKKKIASKNRRAFLKSLSAFFLCFTIILSVRMITSSIENVADTIAEAEMYTVDTQSQYDFAKAKLEAKKVTVTSGEQTVETKSSGDETKQYPMPTQTSEITKTQQETPNESPLLMNLIYSAYNMVNQFLSP